MKLGHVLMRYGLDADGNEISGAALCASTSYKKVYNKIRDVLKIEEREAENEEGTRIYDYDNQIVVEYGGDYETENGVRYIIESIEIL